VVALGGQLRSFTVSWCACLASAADSLRAIGYHGTSRGAALVVLRDGFRVSRNAYDWLGDGVYFFQEAPHRAREWAAQRYGRDGVVIRSVIRLDDCLDLLDIQSNAILEAAYTSIVELSLQSGAPLPRQTAGAHRLDRVVVNYAVTLFARQGGMTVRVVRGVFAEGVPVFPGSAILNRAHVQIAVRDTSLIERSELLGEGEP
jgi:hypothetical protein